MHAWGAKIDGKARGWAESGRGGMGGPSARNMAKSGASI